MPIVLDSRFQAFALRTDPQEGKGLQRFFSLCRLNYIISHTTLTLCKLVCPGKLILSIWITRSGRRWSKAGRLRKFAKVY